MVGSPMYGESIIPLYFAYVLKSIIFHFFKIQNTFSDIKAFQCNVVLTWIEVLQLCRFPESAPSQL